ncbi:hypothetical protein UlMin_040214 [Ulmus minor]
MDAFQQHHRFMRPPPAPSPASDPYQQQPPPARPPLPPQASWYPNQFQYQSPSPPPPQQWAPPPGSYPPPPPPGSYPPPQHHYPPPHQNQFPPPPPRPPVPSHFAPPPPPPPPHSQIPQPYAQQNQEWGTPNWGHHQGWDYQAHSNEEDWAAKARAWAHAKTMMENQHPQPQYEPVGRQEEQGHYPQTGDSHFQQVPVSTTPHRPPVAHPQEIPSVSSRPSSYVPEGHQGNLPISPSVHQQEVPSSYSSVTGNDGPANQTEHSYKLLPLSNSSSQQGQHNMQLFQSLPHSYPNQSADSTTNLADQPLEFAPKFNHDHNPHMQSSYVYHDSAGPIRGMDPVSPVPSMNSWTAPVAPGMAYPPPIPPVLTSGPQHDPALAVPSSVPGLGAPPFSSFPGSGLQLTIPSGGPPFSLGSGTALHATTFSGDAYGISSASERPKKAAVPNWLREEIKKAVITTSSVDHPKEESESIEDQGVDQSLGKSDQADSKSIDSSRSTEEEEDDEDYVEAARTAAINQEIKRVLTEVLLKVTDELFDEIAAKVLNEDDLTVEVDKSHIASNNWVSLSPPAVPLPKATAKVLVPAKPKESETESITQKSSSSSPGDVLGLANYATDDEDDDEIQSSSMPNSRKKASLQQSAVEKPSEERHDVATNNSSLVQRQEHSRNQTNVDSEPNKASSTESKYRKNESYSGPNTPDDINGSTSRDVLGIVRSELPDDNGQVEKTSEDNNHVEETRIKPDKKGRRESAKSSGKDFEKEEEIRTDGKDDGNHKRHDERHLRKEKDERHLRKEKADERHLRKEKADERNGSKDRIKEQGDRKETDRHHRAGAKEESNKKRENKKDEEDRSRHKHASDSSRHRKRRSSSISSRGRSSKENSANYANDSSGEASDESKRKHHSRKRNLSPSLSPSPTRSRRRQVSRSPHSKHSQRRHSPYSSFDTSRRRSRSRSPVRRKR